MSVSLHKESDTWYVSEWDNEAWNSTVLLPIYLSTIYNRLEAAMFYKLLTRNNLVGLQEMLYYEHHYNNATGELVER